MSLGVAVEFEFPGGAVGADDCEEGSRGGYEEGLHGEGEGAEGGEAVVGAEDCCSALGGTLADVLEFWRYGRGIDELEVLLKLHGGIGTYHY